MFKTLALGLNHTCGLTSAGKAYCWGDNGYRQLGLYAAVANSSDELITIDKKLSETIAVGASYNGNTGGGIIFSAIAAGNNYTCGITQLNGSQSSVLCWGLNTYGQLGVGDKLLHKTIVYNLNNTFDSTNLNNVTAGENHSCFLRGNETYCWGNNNYSQVGNSGVSDVSSPVRVGNISPEVLFASIEAGKNHSCGVKANGNLVCWGRNNYYQLGNGTNIDSTLK